MSEFKLHDIHIQSFRGIKDYYLDFEDKSLVLVGENGSGKSSIVNAFEFLFTGQVDSLKGTQAIKHDKSLVHLGDNPEDLSVTASINDLTIVRKLKEEPPENDILDDFANGSFLLNRQKLLKFIELTPKKKYENITSIIGFAELDNIENTLNKTKNSFNTQIKNKKQDLEKKNAEILKIYETEDIDETYEKINETLVKNDYDKITPESDLEKYLYKTVSRYHRFI
ncbi:ATP-binding protein [uncultured Methanobrevibacter sp.]|uniref:AAA family ATPase n=1 Tax=uncultured Methanobrevibacter sp. TaxID=253161 RepID=UPI0025CCC01E|nr:ATP-binding protein [uncultured Methanobrevibacter sp.]